MKLFWSQEAQQDRRPIREHIAEENPVAALALDELFTQKARNLISHPGMARPGRIPGTRELVVHPNYILIYDVAGDEVRILCMRVASGRQPRSEWKTQHPSRSVSNPVGIAVP